MRQRDKLLLQLQAGGVAVEQIAAQLDVTPNSALKRLYHLRGQVQPFTPDPAKLYALLSKLPREKRARNEALLAAMRSAIANGVWRDRAIFEAAQLGAET
jgi:predicted ArsR family transcriptional regulator